MPVEGRECKTGRNRRRGREGEESREGEKVRAVSGHGSSALSMPTQNSPPFTPIPLYMYPFLPDVSVSNKVTLSPSPPGSWLTPLSLGISLLTRLAQGQLGTSPQWARGEDLCSTVEKMLSPHPLGAGTYVVPATAGIYVSLTKEILETKPMQESLPGTPFLWFPPQWASLSQGSCYLQPKAP